jgi:KAP family P-loop domain/CHAT domain
MLVSSELTERPVEQRSEDRLGMQPYAEKLAGLVMRSAFPLTVGIYGPWGAGKTSFANLLVKELGRQPGWEELNFIDFTAWPYITSTAIWQALVEKIARKVYGQEKASGQPAVPAAAEGSRDWRGQLRDALLSNALTLRAAPADPQRGQYEKIMQRLTATADIADRTPSPQLGGLTLGSFGKLVLSAAATMSTSLGPVSQLFAGIGGAAPAAPEPSALESIEQIFKDLTAVFAEAGPTRNVVLVDDLDRCHPEIALDVLETIKIFFAASGDSGSPSSWLFLVPADERLVSAGLRARLGSQSEQADDIDARSYLEKIIQVGVSLPEVKIDSAHSLIADYVPEWAGASDLLISAFDGNPRRIKQQGALLSYRHPDRSLRSGLSEADADALARLVHLGVRHADLPAMVESLRATDPALLRVDIEPLRVLASVADLKPGPGGAPKTKDPVFAYVATLVTDQDGSTTPQFLAVMYLRRLLKIRDVAPDLFRRLAAWSDADEDLYTSRVFKFDSWLDWRLSDGAAEAAADIRRLAEVAIPLLDDDNTRATLTDQPRLSAIPAVFVNLVAADGTPLPADAGVAGVTGVTGDRFSAAALRIADEHAEAVESSAAMLRLDVARDVVSRRKYAKVQLLLTTWSELIRLARGPGGARRLRDLEAAMLRGDHDVPIPQPWRHLTTDESLREFLRLPPSLALVYGKDVSSIADSSPASPVFAESPSASPPGKMSTFTQPTPLTGFPYTNLELAVRTSDDGTDARRGATEPSDPRAPRSGTRAVASSSRWVEGTVTLALNGRTRSEQTAQVRIPVGEIMRVNEQLSDPRLMGRVRPDSLPVRGILSDIGTQLWASLMGANGTIGDLFTRAFESEARLRLGVVSSADILTALPWECLFLPRHGIFAAQTLKLSVVRKIPESAPLPSPRPNIPLRVLIAEANPRSLPIISANEEIALIQKSLEQAKSARLVRVEVLRHAAVDRLWSTVRSFQPHVFHLVGHAGLHNDQGVIILEDEAGDPDFMPADSLGPLMQERGVLLAVLNGCETGWPDFTGMANGVSQTLVRLGVPAVIGTTREVGDTTALRFAGEFYKGMGDGLAAEPALVEARKAISVKGWDWSMYAMYANTDFPLHTIRIQMP